MTKYILAIIMMLGMSTVAMAQDAPACPDGYICTLSGGTTNVNSNTKVESPPPTAISPSINASNSDSCTVGVAGAVQTQILGISAGKTVRDINCERLKNAKTLYDMGMKVAAVSVMCQDPRIFNAMMDAGTPCPYDGMIGSQAKSAWESNPEKQPGGSQSADPQKGGLLKGMDDDQKSTAIGGAGIGALLLLLLL